MVSSNYLFYLYTLSRTIECETIKNHMHRTGLHEIQIPTGQTCRVWRMHQSDSMLCLGNVQTIYFLDGPQKWFVSTKYYGCKYRYEFVTMLSDNDYF